MQHHTHHHCDHCACHDTVENNGAAPDVDSTPSDSAATPLIADKKLFFSSLVSIAFAAWLAGSGAFQAPLGSAKPSADLGSSVASALQETVFPTSGIATSAKWGDAIPQLVALGVIDRNEFTQLFMKGNEPLGVDELAILDQPQRNTPIIFTAENARFTVDVLWALGLAQKSDVLEKGPMRTSGTPTERFASTGGWELGASENPMDYYSQWDLLGLTEADQARVTRIAETIYRPCCGNSTAFPDCNHGMAMLGLIELMVSQGASDEEIYAAAKAANTYWFPDTMIETATYFTQLKQMPWEFIDAKTVVSKDYASGQGAQKIAAALQEAKLVPEPPQGGGSCGA